MKTITKIEELLNLPGKNIGFFEANFDPPHFGHLDFIKKITSIQILDHIVFCTHKHKNKQEIEELKHRMRIMDLVIETSQSQNISILKPEVCNGIQSQIFIDDIFYLLKRRQKEIFVLISCDSFQKCAETFKSLDVTFIIGCKIKRSDVEKSLIAENKKCVFIDDIIPCSAEQNKNDVAKQNIYLSLKMQEYIQQNQLLWFKNECDNCN